MTTKTDSRRSLPAHELASGKANAADAAVSFAPYWWDEAPRETQANGELPRRADVVIVGSGFTGLSAALTFAGESRSTVVLDRDTPGFGASTRNGGQVGSGNQKFRVRRLIALRGQEKAAAMLREGMQMLDYIERLVSSEKIDCSFRRCGRFRAAIRPEHYEGMARDMEDLRAIAGVESFMVPKSEQSSEIGSDVFYGGSVLPNDASIQPALYHSGLMRRVREKGGQIFGHAPATRIERDGKTFRVTTPWGTIDALEVVIATNGYTDSLVPELGRRIIPVGSGLIATEALPEALYNRLLPKNRVYGNTNRVFYYFRGAPAERRIVWGGRAGRAGAENLASYRHLAADMVRVFPDLKDVAVTHAWDGRIGYTWDEIPHLGRAASGVHYAIGYCGTGVSRATYFGHKIALKVMGHPGGRTAFDDLVFPAVPAHPVAVHAVPVVETWYRVRDATNF